jgi:glutamate/tyrosine decarboxylase-like PLP-dependent enzyme
MSTVFPKAGLPREDLLATMAKVREDDPKWREGRMISSVYFVSDELMDLTREAYGAFILENALYSGEYARRRKVGFATLTMFEEEVIAMALEILNAPPRRRRQHDERGDREHHPCGQGGARLGTRA